MEKVFRKIMVLAIIGLFLGTGIVPSISASNSIIEETYVNNQENKHKNNFICFLDNAKSTTGPYPPKDCFMGLNPLSLSNQMVIDGVPAYEWHHGCGPTAAGMVIGYWDAHGFDDLVPGNASSQTEAVNNMIASSGNWYDYCLPIDYFIIIPDKSSIPWMDKHTDNCIADFMKTSQSRYRNCYGWSWFEDVDDALSGYINHVNHNRTADQQYTVSTWSEKWSSSLWDEFKSQIDADHPVVLLVDTCGIGSTDHSITAIGYSDDGNNKYYACYNTWDASTHWYDFSRMFPLNPWGIYGATFCVLTNDNTDNNKPNKPAITGPNSGKADEEYTYYASTTDPDGDQIYYLFDWGDGITSDWIGPKNSGEEVKKTYSWDFPGRYEIKAKAKNTEGIETDWSTLEVSMPKNKAINTTFLNFLENHPHMFPLLRYILRL